MLIHARMLSLRVGRPVVLERVRVCDQSAPVDPAQPGRPPPYHSPPVLKNRTMGVGGSF